MKKIYLDYAATTPLDPGVERAMRPYFTAVFGNPGSLHRFGQEAAQAVYHSRRIIAKAIGAKTEEIVFTGSATEANNLVLRGLIQKSKIKNQSHHSPLKIITTVIEHESILETARNLEKQAVEVVYLPVNQGGLVNLEKLKAALDERTILVSIQYANSEIGVIQPIKEIAGIIKGFDEKILFHTDAVQAFPFLPCAVNQLGVDSMTLSAHKIYGPKGIGLIYIRMTGPISPIDPIITGGGQERGFRSGTENVTAIVGFGKAVELIAGRRQSEKRRIKKLRDYLWRQLKRIFPQSEINGEAALAGDGSEKRLPNNLNLYLPGKSAQDWCLELDLSGVAVSPGTACSAHTARPSYVIEAMGFAGDRPRSSVRFVLGRPTTKSDIDKTLKIIKNLTINQ